MEVSTFIGQSILEMTDKGVTVQFNKRIRKRKDSSSYFYVDNAPTFTINYFDSSNEDIVGTFIHEYCHFKQWESDTTVWKKGISSYDKFYRYLSHKENSISEQCLYHLINLELDADRRALNLIYSYDIDIDSLQYTISSNSYAYAWYAYWKSGCKKFPNYLAEKVLDQMPVHHIDIDILKKNKKLYKLFI